MHNFKISAWSFCDCVANFHHQILADGFSDFSIKAATITQSENHLQAPVTAERAARSSDQALKAADVSLMDHTRQSSVEALSWNGSNPFEKWFWFVSLNLMPTEPRQTTMSHTVVYVVARFISYLSSLKRLNMSWILNWSSDFFQIHKSTLRRTSSF